MAKNSTKAAANTTVAASGNSETIVSGATKATTAEVIASPTKADKARAIFDECYAMPQVPQRKDIIARAVSEAGLTKPGAATYLQNYKTKKGLVAKKSATASA